MPGRLLRGCAIALLALAAGCGEMYMKGTPFYTGEYSKPQGPPEKRVNLWPLAYYHEPALSVLWPFGEWTDDHVALRPLGSVYKLDKPNQNWCLAWPMVDLDFDSHEYQVIPFFWGKDHFVAAPIVWWYEDTKAIFPVVWWKDGFTVFPFAWYQKDDYLALLPFWYYYDYGKGHYDAHALWPLVEVLNKENKTGWRVWPFVGHYTEGGRRYDYALWPLCHYARDGDEITRVAVPFYFEQGDKNKGWWLLLPLAYRSKDGKDSTLITPLWSEGKRGEENWKLLVPFFYQSADPANATEKLITPLWSEGKRGTERWQALIPLFYHEADASKGTQTLVTPLLARSKSPERTEWTAVPILSSVAWGKGEKDVWLLAPLVHARWGGDNVEHHVFPFYAYDRNKKEFLSLPVSWRTKEDKGYVNVAGLLAHYSWKDDGERELKWLLPLGSTWWNTQRGEKGAYLIPFFSWKRSANAERDYLLEKLWVFPWLYSEQYGGADFPGRGDAKPTKKWLSRQSGFFPFWRYDRRVDTPTEGTPSRTLEFELLTWLYDYQLRTGQKDPKDPTKTHDYVRSRLLWRVMHYEKLDSDETLDVFPFITWDRKADGYRKFSFLWRLYRNERTAAGGRNLDLLFLPILRSREGKAAKP
jgi:hypothetical protein